MTLARVLSTRREVNGEESCRLDIDGRSVSLTGALPPIRAGQWLRIEYEGKRLLSAERVVTTEEVNWAFYGRLKGFERDGALKALGVLGEETHVIVTEQPELLRSVKGVTPSTARAMQNHARRQGRLYSALKELADMGIGPELTPTLISHHGAGAAQFIRDNPYAAITERLPLRVIDHAARRLGISIFDPRRAPALAYETVRLACEDEGHTCLPETVLERRLTEIHALEQEEAQQAIEGAYALGHLKADHRAAYLPRQHLTERWLAEDLVRLHLCQTNLCQTSTVPALDAPHLTEEQARAVALGCVSGVTVITGGPGTGKTTTLKALLDSLEAAGLSTNLCAPTGKAASRMTQSTGREATTLHRLLGYDGSNFGDKPLSGDVFVVDEVSMASNELLGALLRNIPDGKRVILVGDEDQLPPIDPGWPLGALVKTMPLARLTKTHRQAEGSPILRLAHQLIAGEVPARTGVPFQELTSPEQLVGLVKSQEIEQGQRPVVLSAGRQGPLGVSAINAALQEAFNPGEGRLRLGDPVMMTRNDHKRGLMNGMTGEIVSLGKKIACLFEEKVYELAASEAGLLELAYAMTIHRSQGSEWPGVIVTLSHQHHQLLSRQLAYTGVTRARAHLVAAGEREAWTRSALTGFPRRYSMLERMLRE
ncbi:helicase RecD/TraA (plasmid) [Deinococcus wulumuqiensis]|uniref:Helicase RecD/TraA n=1 Tax=Deinococcus wulumuqiensis TaxID=980427 RepID=A0A345ILX9_9DEIO|nr:AAA family ATPase [Deinococcus wulumuqiensis]AXH00702.1 helicase RecD/TraA [Deinococcus wulumuqiensis]